MEVVGLAVFLVPGVAQVVASLVSLELSVKVLEVSLVESISPEMPQVSPSVSLVLGLGLGVVLLLLPVLAWESPVGLSQPQEDLVLPVHHPSKLQVEVSMPQIGSSVPSELSEVIASSSLEVEVPLSMPQIGESMLLVVLEVSEVGSSLGVVRVETLQVSEIMLLELSEVEEVGSPSLGGGGVLTLSVGAVDRPADVELASTASEGPSADWVSWELDAEVEENQALSQALNSSEMRSSSVVGVTGGGGAPAQSESSTRGAERVAVVRLLTSGSVAVSLAELTDGSEVSLAWKEDVLPQTHDSVLPAVSEVGLLLADWVEGPTESLLVGVQSVLEGVDSLPPSSGLRSIFRKKPSDEASDVDSSGSSSSSSGSLVALLGIEPLVSPVRVDEVASSSLSLWRSTSSVIGGSDGVEPPEEVLVFRVGEETLVARLEGEEVLEASLIKYPLQEQLVLVVGDHLGRLGLPQTSDPPQIHESEEPQREALGGPGLAVRDLLAGVQLLEEVLRQKGELGVPRPGGGGLLEGWVDGSEPPVGEQRQQVEDQQRVSIDDLDPLTSLCRWSGLGGGGGGWPELLPELGELPSEQVVKVLPVLLVQRELEQLVKKLGLDLVLALNLVPVQDPSEDLLDSLGVGLEDSLGGLVGLGGLLGFGDRWEDHLRALGLLSASFWALEQLEG